MKKGTLQALRLSELIVKELSGNQSLQLKQDKELLQRRIAKKIQENFAQEQQITDEAYKMMEDLEQKGQTFDRKAMFPLLKAKLAEKKGFVYESVFSSAPKSFEPSYSGGSFKRSLCRRRIQGVFVFGCSSGLFLF